MADGDPLHGIAELDLQRTARRGYPEAVYCEGKTVEQVTVIAAALRDTGSNPPAASIFTRCSPEQLDALAAVLPDPMIDATARFAVWPAEPPPPVGGPVVVLCAGTSDLPVAREALLTATHLGRRAELIVDVGVAGLHRVAARLPVLRAARAIVVVAGMDGALAGVVAGLVSAPVIAVPTSVGYGASMGGVAALLGMLASCAAGVTVVNIDTGFGAAMAVVRWLSRHGATAAAGAAPAAP